MADLPNKTRVLIIGGGIVGCSVAYHLTKLGHPMSSFSNKAA